MSWLLSLTTFIFKMSFITLIVSVILAFVGVQPLASYKNTIANNIHSNLAAPALTTNISDNRKDDNGMGIWDKVVTFVIQARSYLPSTLAKTNITGVEGESTFVITIEPNKDALDFEKIYCVVLMAKDGYIFSHAQITWLEFEFRSKDKSDRSVQQSLKGLRVVRLSAPAMDKVIFPMRQEISRLVAKKRSKAESDLNAWFWGEKSLSPYTNASVQERYSVSASERASIARKYVDVKVMLYSDYLTMKQEAGQ